jgi:CRP-like cAMP-binding protein
MTQFPRQSPQGSDAAPAAGQTHTARRPPWPARSPTAPKRLEAGGDLSICNAAPGPQSGDPFAIEQALSPGDVLYVQDSPMHYAYRVESGLLQRKRLAGGGSESAVDIGYSGVGDWLGADGPLPARRETVTAVTPVRLLAMERQELQALTARHALDGNGAESPWRLHGLALKRDWRVTYQLRDLPAPQRLSAALAYLVRWAAPAPTHAVPGSGSGGAPYPLSICLDLDDLEYWLALDRATVEAMLALLVQAGGLTLRDDHLVSWRPEQLLQIARLHADEREDGNSTDECNETRDAEIRDAEMA